MLTLRILTPEQVLFDAPVSKVFLPGTAGQFEVLSSHAPLISSLGPGVIRFEPSSLAAASGGEAAAETSVSIASGFVRVKDDIITVCAEL